MYIPRLPEDAFLPLPDGVVLDGSPTELRFPLFAMPQLGRFEREDAGGRILVALVEHGEWASVKMQYVGECLQRERKAYLDNNPEGYVPISNIIFPDGHERIREGFDELIQRGLLGSSTEDPWHVWPTPQLLELMAPYRTNQPA